MHLYSCNPMKYVGENEYLLDQNTFVFKEDSSYKVKAGDRITAEDLYPIVKQKPNRKLLMGIRFHLRLYSLSNQERINRRKLLKQKKADKKNDKIDVKNRKRIEKGKSAKQYVAAKTTFGEGLQNSGEAPVILDSLKVLKTSKQIRNYLINKGYFHNEVTDSIVLGKKRKAEVIYTITPGRPFEIKNINYAIEDTVLLSYVDSIKGKSLIRLGELFDTDKLAAERARITKYLLNNGYYFFNKEFVYFKIDSTVGDHELNIELGIQNYKVKDVYTGEMKEVDHKQYQISSIELYADYQRSFDDSTKYNVVEAEEVLIKHKGKLKVKPRILVDALKIKKGENYSKAQTELTNRRLSAMGVYKIVQIQYDLKEEDGNELIAKIYLFPSKAQSFNLATNGLNNNGLFGIEGSMTYAHKNLFGGAEKLQISFTGGIEAQRTVTTGETDQTDQTNFEILGNEIISTPNFNTIEFGPKLSLLFPRFLFLDKYFPQSANAKTELAASYNYQQRQDYSRGVQDVSFTWLWHEKAPITYRFTPLSLSAVKIDKDTSFQNKIDALNDRFLAASYDNSIIASGRMSFEYNGQAVTKKRNNVFYAKATFEGAGNLLRTIYKLTNQQLDPITNSYSIFGTRFAQFVKISLDTKYYRTLSKRTKVVYRLAGGLGVPLANLNEALPFQKSYYSGGANGMRAWKSRILGPGAYYDSLGSFDKIGDIQLEGNMEFRFPISSWIEGAWFVDAGNIWLLNKDSLRTNAEFDKARFVNEIAIGSGVGIRLDLDFFIIRFDVSMPFKNPSLPMNERWIFNGGIGGTSTIDYITGESVVVNRNSFFKYQFNLGIGYPF